MAASELMNGAGLVGQPSSSANTVTRRPLFSLRMLLGALVTVSVATAILLWGWATWKDHLEALQKAESDSRFLVRVVEQQARSSIYGALSLVNAAAHRLEHIGDARPLEHPELEAELRDAAGSLQGVRALEIADGNGVLLFSTDPRETPGTVIDAEALSAHRAGTALEIGGATILPDNSGFFTVSQAQRSNGVLSSIILAKIDLAAFTTFNRGLKTDPTTRLGVMRRDAQMVELFPLGRAQSHQTYGNLALFARQLPMRNEGTYDVENAIDGVDRVVSYRVIDGFPLVAFAGISRPQVLADYWNKEFRSATYLVLALVAIGSLAIVMMLNLTREQEVRQRSVALAQDMTLAIKIADLGTFDYDMRTETMGWGGAFRAIFGLEDAGPAIAALMFDKVHPDDRDGEIAAFEATSKSRFATRGDGSFRREFRILRGGDICWVLLQGRALFATENGVRRTVRLVGVTRDITNRHALMAKKDSILREVNHRVMNSLQVLCSILSLQARSIADDTERKRFDEAALRVASLATVHGRLFRTQNLEKIEVGTYLSGLCNDLANSFLDSSSVSIVGRSSGSVLASTDEIMPLGLVVAELVNGAARYIAAGGSRGDINLTFDSRIQGARLTIAASTTEADSQILRTAGGLPAAWCDAFGVTLAEMMIEQIGGTLPAEERSGSRVVIDFPWLAAA